MATESFSKIADLVPQFYFDLIARVAPGVVACVLYGFAFADKLQVLRPLDTTTIILLGFVLAYVIGLVLDLLSEGLFRVVADRLSSVKSDEDFLRLMMTTKEGSTDPILSEADKSLLTKMWAERSLMRVLVLVFLPFVVDWNGSVLHLFGDPMASIMNYAALAAIGALATSSVVLYRCLDERLKLMLR